MGLEAEVAVGVGGTMGVDVHVAVGVRRGVPCHGFLVLIKIVGKVGWL